VKVASTETRKPIWCDCVDQAHCLRDSNIGAIAFSFSLPSLCRILMGTWRDCMQQWLHQVSRSVARLRKASQVDLSMSCISSWSWIQMVAGGDYGELFSKSKHGGENFRPRWPSRGYGWRLMRGRCDDMHTGSVQSVGI